MGKRVRSPGRQIVGHARGEGMPNIKVRIPAVQVWVGEEPRRVEVVGERIGRGNINGVGEGVRCLPLQPSRQTPLELEL